MCYSTESIVLMEELVRAIVDRSMRQWIVDPPWFTGDRSA